MNERRCYVASATLMDKIYACGGFDGRNRLRSAEIYDPSIGISNLLFLNLNRQGDHSQLILCFLAQGCRVTK